MTARTSMQALVTRFRSVTSAARDDEFNGITYWSDDQLELELDQYRVSVWAASLLPIPRQVDGSTVYLQFAFKVPRGYWLENAFSVRDTAGNLLTTPVYTVEINDLGGLVTFASDVGSVSLTIDYTAYDWNASAASVWEQKAAHRFDYIDVKTADHRFDASAEYRHCVERAKWHAARKVKGFNRPLAGFTLAHVGRKRP